MPRPLALLFDLDGTLADSAHLILSAFRHTFATHTGTVPDDAEWIRGMGTPLATQLRDLVNDETLVRSMIATYRTYQHEHHDQLLCEFVGVRETLAELRERGHPMALVTSKSNDLAVRALRRLALDPYINEIVGLDSCQQHKPNPEPVHIALDLLGYSPTEAVFVGDSPHDMAAGNAAGVVTVAALWGPFDRATLDAASPHYQVAHINELPALLDHIAVSPRRGEM